MNLRSGLFEEYEFIPCRKLDRNEYHCEIPLVITDLRELMVTLAILGRVRDGNDVPHVLKQYQEEKLFEGQIGSECGDIITPSFKIDLNWPEIKNLERDGMIYINRESSLGRLHCREFSILQDSDIDGIANIYQYLHRIDDVKKLLNNQR
jgi:hypothetical protein